VQNQSESDKKCSDIFFLQSSAQQAVWQKWQVIWLIKI